MLIQIVRDPAVGWRHALYVGLVLDATPCTSPTGPYAGSVWVTAPGSGERVRIFRHEWCSAEWVGGDATRLNRGGDSVSL